MNKLFRIGSWLCCIGMFVSLGWCGEPSSGWRGNATGHWPDSTVPLQWRRIAHGAMEGLRVQANQPPRATVTDTVPFARKGLLNEWLVLGPLPVRDSVENFDDDLLAKESESSQTAGDKTGAFNWKLVTARTPGGSRQSGNRGGT